MVRSRNGWLTVGAAQLWAEAVQHESTATRMDGGGSEWTPWDGDQRGWTRMDVLPVDGMQEARGSSPLSSTSLMLWQVRGLLDGRPQAAGEI